MQEIAAITLSAMQFDALRLERIAVNLANVSTSGFQREILALHSTAQSTGTGSDLLASGPVEWVAANAAAVVRDVRPGTLLSTGQALDVALLGNGYFEVATPDGPAYTRRGDFQRDALGRLVTAQGWPVMGREGEIQLSLDPAPVEIHGDGRISAGGQGLGQLKVVDFNPGAPMNRRDHGYLTTTEPARTLRGNEQILRQGFLENANVNQGQEMVALMRTVRHFESMSRVLQGHDEMLGNAIRRLGEA